MKVEIYFCPPQLSFTTRVRRVKSRLFCNSNHLIRQDFYQIQMCCFPASWTNTIPQLEDPFNTLSQSQRGSAAMQERVETKGDDVSRMLKGHSIRGWSQGLWCLGPDTPVASDDHTEVSSSLCLSAALPFHRWLNALNMSSMTFRFPHIHYHNHSPVRAPRTMKDAICGCVCVCTCSSVCAFHSCWWICMIMSRVVLWWGAVIILLQRGRRAARHSSLQ